MKTIYILIACFFTIAFEIHAQQHGLDPTFGNNGTVVNTDVASNGAGTWYDVKIQPDGEILAVGTGLGLRIIRFKEDGKRDSSFATNGLFSYTAAIGAKCTLSQDSSIFAAGTLSNNNFAVLKIKYNGLLDSSFGTNGLAQNTGGAYGVSGITLQPDSKIVVSGTTYDNYVAVRFLANGNIDSTFGNNGRVVTYGGLYETQCNAVAVQADGKILLTGRGWYNGDVAFMTIRYKTNGDIDSSFGVNGRAYWQPGTAAAHDIKVLPDGKILLSGGIVSPTAAEVAMRLNSDGSLDTSFNHSGYLQILHPGYYPLIYAFGCHMALTPDGHIVLGGVVEDTTFNAWKYASISRCTADGQIDNSFCINGSQVLTIAQQGSGINSFAIQPDGKIVGVGFSNYGNGGLIAHFTIARFMPDGNVSIVEHTAPQSAIRIFPNPANTSLSIETERPASVRLIGVDGRICKHSDKPATVTQLTTQDLSTGTYFVLITIPGYTSQAKAITVIH